MSIASEYAREYQVKQEIAKTASEVLASHSNMKPMVRLERAGSKSAATVILVNTDGCLQLDGYAYTPKEARRLALWILATFVEE
jgi:hypothetical protein